MLHCMHHGHQVHPTCRSPFRTARLRAPTTGARHGDRSIWKSCLPIEKAAAGALATMRHAHRDDSQAANHHDHLTPMNAMNLAHRAPHFAPVTADTTTCRSRALDEDICVHILTASSVMVGVCLTVVGILRMVIKLHSADMTGNDLLSINAMLYLLSAILSYWALRTRNRKRNHRIAYAADAVFIAGMIFTLINTAFITWAMAAG
jgi:hypothetical protein